MVTQVALYARVSSEQQVEGFSIEAQMRAMREFARSQQWTIFREYVDEGYSASTDQRPQFQVLMRDASVRLFDGLLIHKLDRLYRNVSQLLETVDVLEKQEISLISVLERVDFSTPSGKMLLTNIGMISEFYLNNLREETIKGKYQRALCGLWNGDIPYGYCKGLCSRCDDPNGKGYCPDYGLMDKTDGRRLVAHPKDSIGLRRSFEWRVAPGHSDYDVAMWINTNGYRSRCKRTRKADPERLGGSGLFVKDTVRSMLENPFYLGFVVYRGQLHQGIHPPLVPKDLFEQNQEVRKRWHRNPAQRRAEPRVFPLTGILRCSHCRCSMRGITPHLENRYYRDTGREHSVHCSRRGVLSANTLEKSMIDLVGSIGLPQEWKIRICQLATATPERIRIDDQRRLLISQQDRMQKLFLNGDLGEEEYERRRSKIDEQMKQLATQEPKPEIPYEEVSKTMRFFLENATPEEAKQIYRMLLRTVYVKEDIERLELRKPFVPLIPHIRRNTQHLFSPAVPIPSVISHP